MQADPFGDIGGISYQIEVLMSGTPKGLANLKHPGGAYATWSMQVCVADLGNKRHVELTELGEGGLLGAGMIYSYGDGRKSYNIKFSKDYRNQIAQAIP